MENKVFFIIKKQRQEKWIGREGKKGNAINMLIKSRHVTMFTEREQRRERRYITQGHPQAASTRHKTRRRKKYNITIFTTNLRSSSCQKTKATQLLSC